MKCLHYNTSGKLAWDLWLAFHLRSSLMKSGQSLGWCGRLQSACLHCSSTQHASVFLQGSVRESLSSCPSVVIFTLFRWLWGPTAWFQWVLPSLQCKKRPVPSLYLNSWIVNVSDARTCRPGCEKGVLKVWESCCIICWGYGSTKKTGLCGPKKDLPNNRQGSKEKGEAIAFNNNSGIEEAARAVAKCQCQHNPNLMLIFHLSCNVNISFAAIVLCNA